MPAQTWDWNLVVVLRQVIITGPAQQRVRQDHRHVGRVDAWPRQQAWGHIFPAALRGLTQCPIMSHTLYRAMTYAVFAWLGRQRS